MYADLSRQYKPGILTVERSTDIDGVSQLAMVQLMIFQLYSCTEAAHIQQKPYFEF